MSRLTTIAAVELRPWELPFRAPLRTAVATIGMRRGVAVHVRSSTGRVGIGDAAPLPGFSTESLAEVTDELRAWAAHVPGAPLAGGSDADLGTVGRELTCSSARFAVEQATAAAANHRWWGDAAVEQHRLVADAETAVAAVRSGATTLKAKVGAATLEHDCERLAAIRQRVGSAVHLRVDANGAWADEAAALAALSRLRAAARIDSVEQPTPADDVTLLSRVARAAPCPVAADESLRSAGDAERLLEAGGVAAWVIKPTLCGGLAAARQLMALASRADIAVSVTSTLESAVGREACEALARSTSGPAWSHGTNTGHLFVRDIPIELDGHHVIAAGTQSPATHSNSR